MIGTTNVPAPGIISFRKMNRIQTLAFPAASWVGPNANGLYTQIIVITGYDGTTPTADDRPEIFFNADKAREKGVITSASDYEDYMECCGYISSFITGTGTLRATAFDKPDMDIWVDIKGV